MTTAKNGLVDTGRRVSAKGTTPGTYHFAVDSTYLDRAILAQQADQTLMTAAKTPSSRVAASRKRAASKGAVRIDLVLDAYTADLLRAVVDAGMAANLSDAVRRAIHEDAKLIRAMLNN